MRKLSHPPRRRAGLTILEMLVSTAMLSFIVLGLTAMLIQTQKAFKTGIKQNTITDSGRAIMDMITGDLRQMSDAQNSNEINFFWGTPTAVTMITNYENGVAVRTNELNDIFILQHTNTTWVGVGYSVSNYPGLGLGTLYRYETNWTALAPVFTNNLYSQFYSNIDSVYPSFPNNYWHKVADGVIDLRIRAFDQNGNENDYTRGTSFSYPILADGLYYPASNTLPNSVELEFAILEPEALARLRGLAGNATALVNFLSTNAAPKMEVFRQRVTVASATR
jgi:type II secretory pathway pseudopilin PulG